MIYSIDIEEMLYIFVAVPIISVILLAVAICKSGRRRLEILSMLVMYCAVSWGLFMNSTELHWTTRWLFWSKDYKARVLSQPTTEDGELRHIEWDSWGFAGSDTEAYLVFDPKDSLLIAAKSGSAGQFSGIPCKVVRVRRLESHYYTVLFYTDTDWNDCS